MKEDSWEPKIGDWVVVEHESGYDIGLPSHANNGNFKKGFVGKVSENHQKYKDTNYCWIKLNDSASRICSRLCRLAKSYEIPGYLSKDQKNHLLKLIKEI